MLISSAADLLPDHIPRARLEVREILRGDPVAVRRCSQSEVVLQTLFITTAKFHVR